MPRLLIHLARFFTFVSSYIQQGLKTSPQSLRRLLNSARLHTKPLKTTHQSTKMGRQNNSQATGEAHTNEQVLVAAQPPAQLIFGQPQLLPQSSPSVNETGCPNHKMNHSEESSDVDRFPYEMVDKHLALSSHTSSDCSASSPERKSEEQVNGVPTPVSSHLSQVPQLPQFSHYHSQLPQPQPEQVEQSRPLGNASVPLREKQTI